MASLEELAAALLGEQSQAAIRAENPYYRVGSAADQIAGLPLQAIAQNPGQYKTKDAAILAGVGGLISGLLGAAGDRYQTKLQGRYENAVMDAMRGQTENAQGIPVGLFNRAQQSGRLFGLQRDLQRADALQEYQLARQGKLEDKLLDLGLVPGAEGLVQVDALDPAALEARKAAMKKAAELGAEDDYYGGAGEGQPTLRNPRVKAIEDAKDALRKEFSALPEVKNFSIVEKSAGIIAKAIKDPSAVADQELTRYSILLIEPGMAVREGEQAAIAASQSIPDKWKGSLVKALNGEAQLGADAREGIKRLAIRAYEGHATPYKRALDFYRQRAQEKGIDPDSISYIGEPLEVGDVIGEPPATPAAPGAPGMQPAAASDIAALARAELERRRASRGGL